MQFVGLKPLKENFPNMEVEGVPRAFDLHNDGDFREFTYDYSARALRVSWTMKQPAWAVPETPNTSQRATVASATLLFTGVRSLAMTGQFVTAAEPEGGGLDFVEYKRLGPEFGEIRLVFGEDAEIVVTASRCDLLTTGK